MFLSRWRRGQTVEQVRIRNPATRPGRLAIGLNWLHFSRGAIQFAQLLKRAVSDALIVIGGQHATLFRRCAGGIRTGHD